MLRDESGSAATSDPPSAVGYPPSVVCRLSSVVCRWADHRPRGMSVSSRWRWRAARPARGCAVTSGAAATGEGLGGAFRGAVQAVSALRGGQRVVRHTVASRDTPMLIGFSGAGSAPSCVRGDVRICNENPAILAVCLRVGRVLSRPLAIRGGVSAGHRGCDTPGVRKHLAP